MTPPWLARLMAPPPPDLLEDVERHLTALRAALERIELAQQRMDHAQHQILAAIDRIDASKPKDQTVPGGYRPPRK